MAFDPNTLTPAGQPEYIPPEMLGMREPEYQDIPLAQRPKQQWFTTPDGKKIVQRERQDGRTYYETPRIGEKAVRFEQGKDGSWEPSMFENGGWSQLGKNAYQDKRFMGFLALAAGGALAASYAGAAGAAGSTGSGAAGMGANAGGGLTLGGTPAMAGMGGGTGIGATAGTGALGTGLVGSTTGGLGLTATGAGGAALGVGAAGALAPGFFASEGLGGGAAGAGSLLGNTGGGTNEGLLSKLGANGMTNDLLRGLIGGIGDNVIGNRGQRDANEAVNRANEKVLEAGDKAADLSKFTPYNVSGGLAGATFNNGTATQTLDPRMKGIQDQALEKSAGFLGSVNAGTPEEQAAAAYQKYGEWAKPLQDQQFGNLQNTLNRQGLLGLNVGTQGLAGTPQAGQDMSVNPYYKDFAQGIQQADLKNYENSMRFGQEMTAGQMNLGKGMLGIGTGIDDMGNQAIDRGAKIGEASSLAGARAGGFLTNAANSAAGNLQQRQMSEAAADQSRNKAIWDTIWKGLL